MKAMCNFVVSFIQLEEFLSSPQTLQANKAGDMTVKIETDTAQVATYFTGLQETSVTSMRISFLHRIEIKEKFRYYR